MNIGTDRIIMYLTIKYINSIRVIDIPMFILSVVLLGISVGISYYLAFHGPLPNAGRGVMAIIGIILSVLPFFLIPELAYIPAIISVGLAVINGVTWAKKTIIKE